jgi:hypothetical protein
MGEWSRRDIEEQVDILREHHDGRDFADAVERFAVALDDEERAYLKEVLLERMGAHARRQAALDQELTQGGFVRRTMRRLDSFIPRPPK